MYKLWLYVGEQFGWIRRFIKDRDRSLEDARIALEEAFTPRLKRMLADKMKNDGV